MVHLREITYFLAIAEEGSLSKAAGRLFITQPTLSHFLSKLEEDVGIQLFHRRNNRGLELTEAGQIYYNGAKKVSAIWKASQRDLENCKEAAAHYIRCGTGGADQITHKLVRCLPALQARYPGTEIRSISTTPAEIHRQLLAGELDLGYSAYQEQAPLLTYLPLITSEVDLVLPKGHPLAGYSFQIPGNEELRIPLSMAGQQPFALIVEGSVLRQVEDAYFDAVGFHPSVLAVYTFPPAIKEYLLHSGLAGLCPRHQHFDGMARIALSPPMYYTCGLYYRNDIKLKSPVKYLITLLQEYPVDYDL
ncbi:LysR family transcriptional regulator [uncultured Oscillibacter sp.]|uniref:LysR family transcriptional regulator n=1 Tax=uncultured Oscillibacter sp. TaxID=876091 RepID=UPI002805F4A6|nr:LysR family transcriptional regulator [uncultured Oscillibacter sp.]